MGRLYKFQEMETSGKKLGQQRHALERDIGTLAPSCLSLPSGCHEVSSSAQLCVPLRCAASLQAQNNGDSWPWPEASEIIRQDIPLLFTSWFLSGICHSNRKLSFPIGGRMSHSTSPFLWWVFSHELFAWAGFKLWSSWSLPPVAKITGMSHWCWVSQSL
jgi:hypothetical protein